MSNELVVTQFGNTLQDVKECPSWNHDLDKDVEYCCFKDKELCIMSHDSYKKGLNFERKETCGPLVTGTRRSKNHKYIYFMGIGNSADIITGDSKY